MIALLRTDSFIHGLFIQKNQPTLCSSQVNDEIFTIIVSSRLQLVSYDNYVGIIT